MALLQKINAAIKRHPRLFDIVDRMRPVTLDETEAFLDGFSRDNKPVRFLQIGANDGMSWDPLRRFIIRDHWTGVLVEPLPIAFNQLRRNYDYRKKDLVFVNKAISVGSEDELTFFHPAESLLRTLDSSACEYLWRMASFSRAHLESGIMEQVGVVSENDIAQTRVPCTSVSRLIQEHWPSGDLDLLVCDAEGLDARIVQSVDFARTSLKAVVFESHNLERQELTATELHLTSSGFHLRRAGGDTIAVR